MKTIVLRPIVAITFFVACAIAFTVYVGQASGSEPTSTGSAEYRNDQFQFSLLYPADMTISDMSRGDRLELTFMSETGKQFLLVASPYSQVDIAAGQYAPHNAYGTEDQGLQLRDVSLLLGGDTSQILFVKDGIMYDLVTMGGDEAWLVDILKTWQFE